MSTPDDGLEHAQKAIELLENVVTLFKMIQAVDPEGAAKMAQKMTTDVVQDVHRQLVAGFMDDNITVSRAQEVMADCAGKLLALARMLDIEVENPVPPREPK